MTAFSCTFSDPAKNLFNQMLRFSDHTAPHIKIWTIFWSFVKHRSRQLQGKNNNKEGHLLTCCGQTLWHSVPQPAAEMLRQPSLVPTVAKRLFSPFLFLLHHLNDSVWLLFTAQFTSAMWTALKAIHSKWHSSARIL